MKDEILEDEKLVWERMAFVNYLTYYRMVRRGEQRLLLSRGGPNRVKIYKEHLQSCEQGYLAYKNGINSKFNENGVETVLAIALSHAMKKSRILVNPAHPPSESDVEAIEGEYDDVCASLAKWEYEAGHLKRVKWTAYTAAVALVGASIMPIIDLFSSALDLLSKWIF